MGHKKLRVYNNSILLVEKTYQITKNFPKDEQYNLVSQMRRAAVSVPSNIAEGAARKGKKDFSRFLDVSIASLVELETQYEISHRLELFSKKQEIDKLIEKVKAELFGLRRKINKQS